MDAIMGLYVVLLIIGLALFLLIRPYLQNRSLKKELWSIKNELEFVRGLLIAYEKQYGKELSNKYIEDFLKQAGITNETPLKVKVKMSRREWEEYEKGINKK